MLISNKSALRRHSHLYSVFMVKILDKYLLKEGELEGLEERGKNQKHKERPQVSLLDALYYSLSIAGFVFFGYQFLPFLFFFFLLSWFLSTQNSEEV